MLPIFIIISLLIVSCSDGTRFKIYERKEKTDSKFNNQDFYYGKKMNKDAQIESTDIKDDEEIDFQNRKNQKFSNFTRKGRSVFSENTEEDTSLIPVSNMTKSDEYKTEEKEEEKEEQINLRTSIEDKKEEELVKKEIQNKRTDKPKRYIQLGYFKNYINADNYRNTILKKKINKPFIYKKNEKETYLLLGPYESDEELNRVKNELSKNNIDCFTSYHHIK